ncbi:MAG TPA: VWA domain-containing protein [Solirubrobacteraceae bacterium]|nr:VWA domain-containing protein [Solirubrobacteraceae bacterium]
MSTFTLQAYQNEYLPLGGTDVNAIVTVTSDGAGGPSGQPEAAVVVIVDTSGSMGSPSRKIKAAREATSVAIDCIRAGVAFAVIAGNDHAFSVYPRGGELAISSEQTRTAAKRVVSGLTPAGGTAIGSWLKLAGELFRATPDRIYHAILLTDGENQHETPAELDAVLAEVEGVFSCDCRGVGTDWQVSELRKIASRLLGTVDIIAQPEAMAEDFRVMMHTAMGKATRNVDLRLWTPQGATVAFVRQVAPAIEELTDRAVHVNDLTADYPTATWGAEARDYHVCINVPPREAGEEMLAGRISLVEGDQVLGQALVKAIWTEDQQLSTRISREVAHYTGQAELADCIQDGLEARKRGDFDTATFRLGRAVQLAAESGNDGTMKLLQAVVEVDDAATGTVRLRGNVSVVDEMSLDTRSTSTVRVGAGAGAGAGAP